MCNFIKRGCPLASNESFNCRNVKYPKVECFETLLAAHKHLKNEADFMKIKIQQILVESDMLRDRLKYERSI